MMKINHSLCLFGVSGFCVPILMTECGLFYDGYFCLSTRTVLRSPNYWLSPLVVQIFFTETTRKNKTICFVWGSYVEGNIRKKYPLNTLQFHSNVSVIYYTFYAISGELCMNGNIGYKKQQSLSLAQFLTEIPSFIVILAAAILSRTLIIFADLLDSLGYIIRNAMIICISRKLSKDLRFEYNYGIGKNRSDFFLVLRWNCAVWCAFDVVPFCLFHYASQSAK